MAKCDLCLWNQGSGGGGSGGGGGLVVLQGTLNDDPTGVLLSNTYAEIYAMLQTGPVAVNCPDLDGGDINYLLLTSATLSEGVYTVISLQQMSGQGSASDPVLLTMPW